MRLWWDPSACGEARAQCIYRAMAATDQVQAAIAQAARLQAEARVHKSNAEFHRREAKRKQIELAQFVEDCHKLGITVVLEATSAILNDENLRAQNRSPTSEGEASGDNDPAGRPHP